MHIQENEHGRFNIARRVFIITLYLSDDYGILYEYRAESEAQADLEYAKKHPEVCRWVS